MIELFLKVVSLLIIAYRVATFNNCDDAAKELSKVKYLKKNTFLNICFLKEINEAKKDLEAKGFKFK